MITNTFIIEPGNKNIVFIRTDTGKLFKISNRKINSDGHINENDGLVQRLLRFLSLMWLNFTLDLELNPKGN